MEKVKDIKYEEVVDNLNSQMIYYYVRDSNMQKSRSWYKNLCDMDDAEIDYVITHYETYLRRAKRDNWMRASWSKVNDFWCKVDYLKQMYDKAFDKKYWTFKYLSI